MTAGLPPAGRRESKAASVLRDAERSPCPQCGRETKTVSGGVCADCWGVKDPEHVLVVRPEPKTEPLVDWDGLSDWWPAASWVAGTTLVAVVGALVWVLVR
jgi:hypothetical protein